MVDGDAETVTAVTKGGGEVTVIVAVPAFVKSCVETAVMFAVPDPDGVKIPEGFTVPSVADHVTAVLNAPVPFTVEVHEVV
jgi:hypothetical protein